ncbi:MAG: hypothetical protein QM831_07410 [Kofleriaceae bacterium]
MRLAFVLGVIAMTRIAAADDETPGENVPAAAAPVAVAPDQVSGVAIDEHGEDHPVYRGLLLPVRYLTIGIMAPFRGGAYLLERYQLRDRIEQLLFNDDGTFGVYPTAFIESQLGFNVGIHAIESNAFGHKEKITAAASYGGEFQQAYEGTFATGELLGAFHIRARGSYQAWNRSNFFGIGNANQRTPVMETQVDALTDDTSYHTRFGQDVSHGEIQGTVTAVGPLSFGVTAAYTRRRFNANAIVDEYEKTIAQYDATSLVGYLTGVDNFYGEASVTFDTRSYRNRYISLAAPSTGWWATAWIGDTQGIEKDPSDYVRYGVDVHRYIDIYHGDRVLILRGYLEAVTAKLSEIPFTDLPRIGGNDILRGYEVDRFRDRAAAVVTAEYDWPLHYGLTGYIFCDMGRVANSVGDLDPSDIHVGYGGGIQVQSLAAFLVRGQIAYSGDGIFFRLALDPIADTRSKQRRL